MTVIYHHRHRRASACLPQQLRKNLRSWLLRDTSWRLVAIVLLLLLACACLASEPTGSIGAVLGRDTATGAVHLREVPPGMAAAEAGLIPGDRLKMIDGVLVDELDVERIQTLLRGPVGSRVTLTILRGDQVMQVEIGRSELGKAVQAQPAEERIE